MMRTFSGSSGAGLLLIMLIHPAANAAECGDSEDPFAAFYGYQGIGKEWHVSMVAPDHEDHGLHLSEGDTFVLRTNESCEVVLVPGPGLALRWGPYHQHLGRESKAIDPRTISNELCTTMGLGHGHAASGNIVARPHLVRLTLVGAADDPTLEIRYGHRSSLADNCSNDGLLDSIHGGVAHAED